MDKMREEFERWIDGLSYSELDDFCALSAWKAWQASRQALVVELPEVFDAAKDDAAYYEYAYHKSDIEKALDSAGVEYK